MSIEEYALELGISVEKVISTLNELGYKYNNKNDFLDDEAIIVLDNEKKSKKSSIEDTKTYMKKYPIIPKIPALITDIS